MFGYTGDTYSKSAISPTNWLKNHEVKPFLEKYAATGGIFGHTRGGTRGGAIDANAHPFVYGEGGKEVILSHNGVVDAPTTYAVDSMWMADLLSKHEPGNYQEALKDVSGWFALTWLDRRSKEVYFLNWDAQLAFVEEDGVLYYSSSPDHLRIALSPKRQPHVTNDAGEVWCWNGQKMRQRKKFTGTKRKWIVNNTYDPLGLVGNIVKMPNGRWYASLRGPGFVPLKYQKFWNDKYPGVDGKCRGGSRYIWNAGLTEKDLDWKGQWVDWDGKPLLDKRNAIRALIADDTELEPSEQGVIVVDQAGVSDRPLAVPSAGDGTTSVGTDAAKEAGGVSQDREYQAGRSVLFDRPNHALVKQDVHDRMMDAEDDDAVWKALQLQEQIDRMAADRDSHCPTGVPRKEQERLRNIEAATLRAQGFQEQAIEEMLARRGYYNPCDDEIHDPDVPPRRRQHYSYR